MAARRKPLLDESSLAPVAGRASSLDELIREARNLPVEKVHPNPHQPRKTFDPQADDELKRSIQALGVLEPILVRPSGDDYEVICGERRYRAACALGLKSIPALVRKADDLTALRMAYEENVQREDLNLLDEARFLQGLIDRGLVKTRQDLASSLAITKGRVSQKLAVLNLPPELQEAFAIHPFLTDHHARVLSQVDDLEARARVLSSIITRQLSGRQAETFVKQYLSRPRAPRPGTRRVEFEGTTLTRDRSRYVLRLPTLPAAKIADLLAHLARAIRHGKLNLPHRS